MRYLTLLLLPLAAGAPAQDRGPGIAPVRQGDRLVYPASGFTGVGFGLAARVEVRTGGAFSVTATGPAAAFANVRVVRREGSLDIGRRRMGERGNEALERQIVFRVTMPRIEDAALGGSGRMVIDRAAGDVFEASVGGSGGIQVGALAVNRARVNVGGSGSFAAASTARTLQVNMGGSGSVDAPGLRASQATVSSAGSGSVRATVQGPATVSLVGSGGVDLGPAARCNVTRMGSGRVRCGG